MVNKILETSDKIQTQKINSLIDSLTNYLKTHNDSDNSALISLISAFLGGFLVIVGQFLIERFKTKTDKTKELNNIVSELVRQRGLLKNLYRELAMYKTHTSYWWFSTLIEHIPENVEINRQDHLRSQASSRLVEREIGEAIATFFGLIAKFETIKNKTYDFSINMEKISILKYRSAIEYNINQDYDKVRNEIINKDEEELRNEYYENLAEFDKIISKIRNK
jgi:hypothetical protein